MALPAQIVAFLLSEHAREPFAGPVLAYGKQSTNFSYDGALWMMESLGLVPDPAAMADPPAPGSYIELAYLIRLLGLGELQTLDIVASAGATFVADLNDPVPAELIGRFGLIVDAGAMERVFDIRQGMKNTAEMLHPGGRVVHVSAVNNHGNSELVQISPTLYYDYYGENGFDGIRGTIAVQPRNGIESKRWHFFQYDPETMGACNAMFCTGETQLGMYFTARRTASSTSVRVPMQDYFRRINERRDLITHQFIVSYDDVNASLALIHDPEPGAGSVRLFTPIFKLAFGAPT